MPNKQVELSDTSITRKGIIPRRNTAAIFWQQPVTWVDLLRIGATQVTLLY